jgi:hypothetical protein
MISCFSRQALTSYRDIQFCFHIASQFRFGQQFLNFLTSFDVSQFCLELQRSILRFHYSFQPKQDCILAHVCRMLEMDLGRLQYRQITPLDEHFTDRVRSWSALLVNFCDKTKLDTLVHTWSLFTKESSSLLIEAKAIQSLGLLSHLSDISLIRDEMVSQNWTFSVYAAVMALESIDRIMNAIHMLSEELPCVDVAVKMLRCVVDHYGTLSSCPINEKCSFDLETCQEMLAALRAKTAASKEKM